MSSMCISVFPKTTGDSSYNFGGQLSFLSVWDVAIRKTKSNLIRGANRDSFIKCKNTFTSTVLLIRTVAGLVIDLKLYTSKQQIHWSGFGV